MNAMEPTRSEAAAESVILRELKPARLTAAELTKRVLAAVKGLKPKQCKASLDSLVDAQKIHGVHKLGKNGKPTKTVETYVFGAPPPPPTPPRELAPKEILALLEAGPLLVADLKKRVNTNLPGLAAADYNSILAELVIGAEIHGINKLGQNGRPTRTIESYVFGPPPPPPPPARELAPKEILALLEARPLLAGELKKRVQANVPALATADYNAILTQLIEAHQIHGRPAHGKSARAATRRTIESYALGGPPVDDFIAPVLEKWKEMRAEAAAAGVNDQALVTALLEGLGRYGVSARRAAVGEPPVDDRAKLLLGVQDLVAREGHGALIPIRKLRASLQLAKDRFDAALLQLYTEDALILHHHDYVGNLSDAERDELVLDRHGNYYVGVALRGER